ncbi:Hypothetical protein, putative [Bodo saltans]|uniref:Uncharacterized protein n=1 Tax=Bodo saltans TaxID=75058 RepID=A0A0S4IJU5_BODSA|nr:Hypothetical protein, putative [Bodo saltans]|eukprot:CUE59143.1 Hypothetical protein, putative [Bodo saltans]
MGSGCSSDSAVDRRSATIVVAADGSVIDQLQLEEEQQRQERRLALLQNCEEHLQVARELRDQGEAEKALPYFLHALRGRVEYHQLNVQVEEELHGKAKKRRKRAAAAAAQQSAQQTPVTGNDSTQAQQLQDADADRPPQSLTAWAAVPTTTTTTAVPENIAQHPAPTQQVVETSTSLIELRPLLEASNRSSQGGGGSAMESSDSDNPSGSRIVHHANVKGMRNNKQPRHQRTTPATNHLNTPGGGGGGALTGDSLENSTNNMMNSSLIGVVVATTITRPRAYFHSHVSLLNEIGNIHLRLGNLHLAFFYYFETISILTPVLTASAEAGVKHSGLPSYVDAIIGVALVYISLAESVAVHEERDRAAATRRMAASFRIRRGVAPDGQQYPPSSVDHSPLLPGGAAVVAQFNNAPDQPPQQQLPHHVDDNMAANIEFAFREMMPLSPTQYVTHNHNDVIGQSGTAGSTVLGASGRTVAFHQNYHELAAREVAVDGGVNAAESSPIITNNDLVGHGLDPSPAFRASVATLAKRLQGCHPLIVARDQLVEAARVIQRCDSARSVHLIPIMHMQCRIALIFDQKKLALHLMQKCLGLTYWYRNGASDAYALAIYSHKSLARIRYAIKRSDAATKIQRWYWRHHKNAAQVALHYQRMHGVVNLYKDTPVSNIVATDLPISPTTRVEHHALTSPNIVMAPPVLTTVPTSYIGEGSISVDNSSKGTPRSGGATAASAAAVSGGRPSAESRDFASHELPSLGRKGGRVSSVAGVVYGRSPQPDRPVSTVKFSDHVPGGGGSSSKPPHPPHYHTAIPELKDDENDDLLTLVRDIGDDEDEDDNAQVVTIHSSAARDQNHPHVGSNRDRRRDDDSDDDDDDDDGGAQHTSSRSRRVVETKESIVDTITNMFQSMQRTVSAASFRSSGTPLGMLANSGNRSPLLAAAAGGGGGGSTTTTPKLSGNAAAKESAFAASSSIGSKKMSFNGAVSVTSEEGYSTTAPTTAAAAANHTSNSNGNRPTVSVIASPSPHHEANNDEAAVVGTVMQQQQEPTTTNGSNQSFPSTPMLTISPTNNLHQQQQQQRSSVFSSQTTAAAQQPRVSVSSSYPATVAQQESGALQTSISVSEYSDGSNHNNNPNGNNAATTIVKLGSASNGVSLLQGSTGLGSFTNDKHHMIRGGTTSTTSGGLTDLDSTPEHNLHNGQPRRIGSLVSQPGGPQYSTSTTPGRSSPPVLPPELHAYQGMHHQHHPPSGVLPHDPSRDEQRDRSVTQAARTRPSLQQQQEQANTQHEFDADSVCSEEGLRSLSRPYDAVAA